MYILKLIKSHTITKCDVFAILFLLLSAIVFNVTPAYENFRYSGSDVIQNSWLALVGADDNTYITDMDRRRILVVSPSSKILYYVNEFPYIDNFTVDKDGKIYVIDTTWKANSFKVSKDTLYSYDPNTHDIIELYRAEYENATKHQMFGVKIINDEVHFICADDDKVTHVVVDKNGYGVKQSTSIAYNDAITVLQDICIENSGTKFYAIDKRGEIICFDEKENKFYSLCRWDNINGDSYVELYRLDISANNVIYATEIVNNNLVAIKDGKISILYSGNEGMFNVATAGADKIGVITDGSFVIIDKDGKILRNADKIYWPFSMKIQGIINTVAFISIILIGIYLALRLIIFLVFSKLTTSQLISRVVILSLAIVVSTITYQLLSIFYDRLISERLDKLEFIAYSISKMIKAEDMDGVKKPSDFRNSNFMKLETALANIIDYNYDDSMYGNIVRYDKDKNIVYDLAFRDNSIGAYYPLLGNEAEEVIEVYESSKNIRSSILTENGGFSYVKVPILSDVNSVIGVIEIGTETNILVNQVKNMIQNIMIQLAVTLVMILFIFNEIFEFMNLHEKEAKLNSHGIKISLPLSRLLIFLVFLAYNIPTAFLPVYVANNYLKTASTVNGLAMSAPISVNMALLGTMGLIGYFMMKKFSFSNSMLAGALITMAGDLILAVAPGFSYIILGLILNGIGVGLQMNLTHSINIQIADERKDSSIYTIYQSSSLSGIMVGMTLGAILADIIGQGNVFFITAVLWLLIAIIMILFLRKVDIRPAERKVQTGQIKFFFTKEVFAFLFLVVFFYVMITSFVYYYVPIYNDQLGYSSNTACLLIILFALCGIYLPATTTKFMTEKFGKNSIYISSILSMAALIAFAFFHEFWVLIAVLFTLGLAASFGTAVRLDAFSKLKKVREFGAGAATGIYDLVDNIGGAIGPMIFASMFAGDFLTGILIFAGISLAALAIYFFIDR